MKVCVCTIISISLYSYLYYRYKSISGFLPLLLLCFSPFRILIQFVYFCVCVEFSRSFISLNPLNFHTLVCRMAVYAGHIIDNVQYESPFEPCECVAIRGCASCAHTHAHAHPPTTPIDRPYELLSRTLYLTL